ncbi:MAG: SDR family NAD(P)-dependent oxidoreductase [Salibacteraceae bacterium]
MKKTLLITGSTDGIGKLAALQLAQAGHTILLHGRNAQKLEATVNEISAAAKGATIKGFVADFSNLQEVERMAEEVKNTVPRLDVLINNAGVYQSPQRTDAQGRDLRFTVNYLAPYVLTAALRPALASSAAPRVLNLSSAAQAPVSLDALAGKEALDASNAYAQSKLALTMWSFDLARQWDFDTVIAVNPGSLLNTRMVKEAFGRHWAEADKGANILFDLATNATYLQSSGQYFDNDQGAFGPAHGEAYDLDKIQALMQHTQTLLAT